MRNVSAMTWAMCVQNVVHIGETICDYHTLGCATELFLQKCQTFARFVTCVRNTVSLPDSPIAVLGQGPLACSCDAPSLLQLHKRTQRAFNWLQCIPIGGGIWRSGKQRIRPCRRQLKGIVSIHSHWITQNFTPGSKYSPYCRLILQRYLFIFFI